MEERERAEVYSSLVTLAENNFQFRKELIDDLEGTIRRWGFVLTVEEMEEVQAQHSELAGMNDFEILFRLAILHRGLPGFPDTGQRR